jgi:hypothetical protein
MPRALVILVGWASAVVVVAGLPATAWLIGPAVTFVVLIFWTWLLGPLGAILAIPLTLLAKVLLVDIDLKAKWADALLRASAKEPEPVAEGDPAAPKNTAHRARRDHEQLHVT